MSCSSRISRIIPTALPLTWDSIPTDIQPLLTPTLPFDQQKRHMSESQSPKDLNENGLPNSPVQERPSNLPATSPFKIFLWTSPRSDCPPPRTWDERYNYGPSKQRFEDRHHAVSKYSTQQRNASSDISTPAPPAELASRQGTLPRVSSSPTFTTSPEKTRWMMVPTSVHIRHSRQNKSLLHDKADDTKTHRQRYSHVVRTDALVPSHAQSTDCDGTPPPKHKRQPRLTDEQEIDWATYFRSQPLPTSAKWSRPEATVHSLDGIWTSVGKTINS